MAHPPRIPPLALESFARPVPPTLIAEVPLLKIAVEPIARVIGPPKFSGAPTVVMVCLPGPSASPKLIVCALAELLITSPMLALPMPARRLASVMLLPPSVYAGAGALKIRLLKGVVVKLLFSSVVDEASKNRLSLAAGVYEVFAPL